MRTTTHRSRGSTGGRKRHCAASPAFLEDEADVFLLRAIAGLTAEEVAWIVGKPRAVVHALQQRAIERLVQRRAQSTELVA